MATNPKYNVESVCDIEAFYRDRFDKMDPEKRQDWLFHQLATRTTIGHTEARNGEWWRQKAHLAEQQRDDLLAAAISARDSLCRATWPGQRDGKDLTRAIEKVEAAIAEPKDKQ